MQGNICLLDLGEALRFYCTGISCVYVSVLALEVVWLQDCSWVVGASGVYVHTVIYDERGGRDNFKPVGQRAMDRHIKIRDVLSLGLHRTPDGFVWGVCLVGHYVSSDTLPERY